MKLLVCPWRLLVAIAEMEVAMGREDEYLEWVVE
jgi:hypothetical protein